MARHKKGWCTALVTENTLARVDRLCEILSSKSDAVPRNTAINTAICEAIESRKCNPDLTQPIRKLTIGARNRMERFRASIAIKTERTGDICLYAFVNERHQRILGPFSDMAWAMVTLEEIKTAPDPHAALEKVKAEMEAKQQ